MSALANAVSASDSPWTLTSPLTVSSFPAEYTIDSEQVLITGGAHPRWSVTRGQNGSAKAAHAAGTALTAGWGGGGGGVTVEVPPAAPVSVTNIVAAGATIAGESATLPLSLSYEQIDLSYTRAGYVDPVDNGVSIFDMTAGSFYRFVIFPVIATNPPLGALTLTAGLVSAGPVDGLIAPQTGGPQTFMTSENSGGYTDQSFFLCEQDCHVFAALYGGPFTAGVSRVVAIITTPAS